MVGNPRIDPEYATVEDDDMLAFRNQALDIPSGQSGVLPGRGGRRSGDHGTVATGTCVIPTKGSGTGDGYKEGE